MARSHMSTCAGFLMTRTQAPTTRDPGASCAVTARWMLSPAVGQNGARQRQKTRGGIFITRVVGVSITPQRLPMRAGQQARLRDLGYDEIWLQNWLVADPARLGLGDVRIVAQELTAPRGGSLDILAADGDTYYSVEVQLGEVDASHSFRVFDYWARNRARFDSKTHVAVLVVESAAGRFRPAPRGAGRVSAARRDRVAGLARRGRGDPCPGHGRDQPEPGRSRPRRNGGR